MHIKAGPWTKRTSLRPFTNKVGPQFYNFSWYMLALLRWPNNSCLRFQNALFFLFSTNLKPIIHKPKTKRTMEIMYIHETR